MVFVIDDRRLRLDGKARRAFDGPAIAVKARSIEIGEEEKPNFVNRF
jgi:hypothetical protein